MQIERLIAFLENDELSIETSRKMCRELVEFLKIKHQKAGTRSLGA